MPIVATTAHAAALAALAVLAVLVVLVPPAAVAEKTTFPTASPPPNLHGSFRGVLHALRALGYLASVHERLGPTLSTAPASIGRSASDREILALCVGQCHSSSEEAPAARCTQHFTMLASPWV